MLPRQLGVAACDAEGSPGAARGKGRHCSEAAERAGIAVRLAVVVAHEAAHQLAHRRAARRGERRSTRAVRPLLALVK